MKAKEEEEVQQRKAVAILTLLPRRRERGQCFHSQVEKPHCEGGTTRAHRQWRAERREQVRSLAEKMRKCWCCCLLAAADVCLLLRLRPRSLAWRTCGRHTQHTDTHADTRTRTRCTCSTHRHACRQSHITQHTHTRTHSHTRTHTHTHAPHVHTHVTA